MHKGVGELSYIIIDSQDSSTAVPFWSAVLGREVKEKSPPYTDLPKEGQPTASIQQVERWSESSSHTHIDIVVEDLDAAIGQITALGGALVEMKNEGKWCWAIMSDPDGNIFCLVTN